MAKKQPKRPSKKPTKRARRAQRDDIGILSSIPFTGALKTAFEDGLKGTLKTANIKQNLGYDAQALDNAVRVLNANVNLIVTVGGLITAERAQQIGAKPFISLVGDSDALTGNNFKGAVDLQSFKLNPGRINVQTQFQIRLDQIGLLSNQNSAMTPTEQGQWPNQANPNPTNVVTVDIDSTTTAASLTTKYQAAFADFTTKSVLAVIISADPWFANTADVLVPIADAWANVGNVRRICYPLFDFEKQVRSAHGHRHTLHGATLETEYKRLGAKAKQVSAHPNDPWTNEQAEQKTQHVPKH